MLRISPFLLAAALAAPACKKDEPRPAAAEPPAPAAPAAAAPAHAVAEAAHAAPKPEDALKAEATAEKPAPTSAPAKDEEQVRPPTKDDLERYTKDIKGKGPLQAKLETSLGTLNCELFDKKAPMTVANFVGLARGLKPYRDPRTGQVSKRPFYDGLIFHRVIPDFMIQGGDPLGEGKGDPGYRFETEVDPTLQHDRPGILAMANAGPNTNGSQFYITERPTPHLNGGYNIFGLCKEVDVVKKIARVEKDSSDPTGSRPKTPVILKKVTIHR